MQDNDTLITNIKNYCDTLLRNFELEPDREHNKKIKIIISCTSIPKVSICIHVHVHRCDSVLKLDLQI